MLSLSNFAIHPKCNNTYISQNPISKTHHFYPKNVNFLKFSGVLGKIPSGFCSYASRKDKKDVKNVLEIEEDDKDFDFFDEDFDVDDGDGDGDVDYDEDEDDEVIIPLRNMNQWLENKPRGFGESKVYDTSIEDKLMEEIEQSRKAQLANVNILKNSPEKSVSKKEQVDKSKVSKDVQEGYRVRLVNLPKKKNVHRDLRLAFEGVPGMINIAPAVYGNKKTRDPVCKGFAFINFKSESEAFRFVQTFSGQSIAFGKVQKQIRCELLNSDLTKSAYKQSVDDTNSDPQLEPPSVDGIPDANYDANTPSINSWEGTASYKYEDVNEEHLLAVSEDDRENFEISSLVETNLGDTLEEGEGIVTSADEEHLSAGWKPQEKRLGTSGLRGSHMDDDRVVREESANSLPSLKQQKKSQENAKKGAPKRKKEKNPTLNIPGSANRLKIRDKAMLTHVFSKYASNTASATKEQS